MIQWINRKRNKKGFTLIELIVVIAILGILMALAIPRFSGFTNKAKIAADEQYASIVANALLIEFATDGVEAGTYSIANTGVVTLTVAEGEEPEDPTDVGSLVEVSPLQYYDSAEIGISLEGDKTITMKKADEADVVLGQ